AVIARNDAEAFAATLDLINDLSQAYEFPTVAAFKASLIEFPDGKTIRLLDRDAKFNVISGTGTANTFNIIASTSVSQSIELINESPVNVKQWGATGDGITDDRLVIFAAMDFVSALSGTLYFPIGDYRMTAGYTNSGANNDIRLLGEGVNRENLKVPQVASTITVDSTNPASFFYKQASRHFLQVEGLIFRSAQYAGNRKYFIFDNGGAVHNFQNVNFEGVEKPINYTANCYFQNAAFRDVQFRASGTFHSESNNIVGTLLLLDNVNHESTVPLNSDKVVCDLRGIREIQGTNFLLEGSLAETGWTIIRTDATASTDWIQSPTMSINGFHSEWSINHPDYVLDLVSGYYEFSAMNAFVADDIKVRLNTKAKLVLNGLTISSGTPVDIPDYFEFVDLSSTVSLENCGSRLVSQPLNPRITLNNFSRLDTDDDVSNTLISNDAPILLTSFDGGYFDGDQTTITQQNGTTSTPSTDATYGRKLAITAGTAQRYWLSVINNENWTVGEQFIIKARVRLPTFTGGLYKISAHVAFTDVTAINYDSTNSGQIVETLIPFRVLTTETTLGVSFADNNPTGVVGDFEVLTIEIYRGANITNSFQTIYPKFVTTYNSAAPTLGSWKQGDRVYDSTPSASGFAGFICTAGGTPGTWKTFGAISA
ncbi:MAG TPA: hypothetical protein EYN67_15955, partial [Flavobacteriales bacterium]|nr:hypothetical protein [Flavobacteriales bacterium]